MPLLKLWNSLCGRSEKPANSSRPANPTAAEDASQSDAANSAKSAPAEPKPRQAKRARFGLGRGPHAGLVKMIRRSQYRSVLEVSVEDGSRATAVMSELSRQGDAVLYAAIDQFELAGGPLTLKQFHRQLRAAGVQSAKIFPESIPLGLRRVATTIGPVDLLLLAAPTEQWQRPEVLPLIQRVTHSGTCVLFLDEETWKPFEIASSLSRRAA